MADEMKQENRPSQQRKALNAGIAGGIMGVIGGLLIGTSLGYAWQGASLGGLLIGAGEAFFDWTRKAGEMKPFLWRLLVSTFLGAAFGALWGLLFPSLSPIFLGFVLGLSQAFWA